MHAKTLLLDRRTILTGSCNMSNNGLENNKEHMWRIQEPHCVEELLTDFEALWVVSKAVTSADIDKMTVRSAKEEDESKSSSRQPSRSVSRSLSAELEEAAP